uniref:Uncharacterized protein n=1 Tax=Cacopsylla melanoneura TaxID=428564 RepID=A0A8D8RNH3_9HEMI
MKTSIITLVFYSPNNSVSVLISFILNHSLVEPVTVRIHSFHSQTISYFFSMQGIVLNTVLNIRRERVFSTSILFLNEGQVFSGLCLWRSISVNWKAAEGACLDGAFHFRNESGVLLWLSLEVLFGLELLNGSGSKGLFIGEGLFALYWYSWSWSKVLDRDCSWSEAVALCWNVSAGSALSELSWFTQEPLRCGKLLWFSLKLLWFLSKSLLRLHLRNGLELGKLSGLSWREAAAWLGLEGWLLLELAGAVGSLTDRHFVCVDGVFVVLGKSENHAGAEDNDL